MQSYLVEIIRADGTAIQRPGEYSDGLAAVELAREMFPDATSIKVERAATAQRHPVQHDTERLPSGAYYFAPGAVEPDPDESRDRFGSMVRQLCAVVAVSGLLGWLAAFLQAKGWPQ